MRTILVFLSDTHGGCRYGLMNPNVTLYDETEDGELKPYSPTPTATQQFIWEHVYRPQVNYIFDLANGDQLYVNHNGDETHGDKFPNELVSTRKADQIEIAVTNLSVWYEYPNLQNVTLEAGTGAHSFLEATSTILVVKQLNSQYGKTELCHHPIIDYCGVLTDVAHHGPAAGSRNWLIGNAARGYLLDNMMSEIQIENRPARLYMRAHYHTPVHEYLDRWGYVSELYVTPSLCGIGEHGIQATRSISRVTWGMIAFEIVDGEIVKCHKLYNTQDIRTKKIFPMR